MAALVAIALVWWFWPRPEALVPLPSAATVGRQAGSEGDAAGEADDVGAASRDGAVGAAASERDAGGAEAPESKAAAPETGSPREATSGEAASGTPDEPGSRPEESPSAASSEGGATSSSASSGPGSGAVGSAGGAAARGDAGGGSTQSAAPPRIDYAEVHFREGGADWHPIYARVVPLRGLGGDGFRVEPLDTRTPDQREVNLPLGRPRLEGCGLGWNADEIERLEVRALFERDGLARIYFTSDPAAESYPEANFVECEVRGGEQWGTWVFDLSSVDAWMGTVHCLRLDLVDSRSSFAVDWLRAIGPEEDMR